jgi:tetratricopeptide (TPR) repeat protein
MSAPLAALVALALLAVTGCPTSVNARYHRGQDLLAGKQYQPALDEFNKILEKEPDGVMALFGKARCLYGLGKFSEALPAFEDFLKKTYEQRDIYRHERYDAEFYRDKCKQALGEEVPQNPADIPPPPMGE